MNIELLEALAVAWRAWDETPGDRNRAIKMTVACRNVADALDVPTTVLRGRLIRHRTRGLDRASAIRAALEDLSRSPVDNAVESAAAGD